MTICSQCNGAGAHQGAKAPLKDNKGNDVSKKNHDTGSTASGSVPCQQCRGTGIGSAFA